MWAGEQRQGRSDGAETRCGLTAREQRQGLQRETSEEAETRCVWAAGQQRQTCGRMMTNHGPQPAIRAAREIKANEVVHSLLQLRCGCVGHAEWEQCLPRTSSHLSWPRWSRASHLLGCCVAQEFDSKRGRKTGESQERGSRLWRELHGTCAWVVVVVVVAATVFA